MRSAIIESIGSIPAFSAIVNGIDSNASAYCLIASCTLPSKLSAHSFKWAAKYASTEPPPATMDGFSRTSFTTINASCIERSASSTTLCEPPRIRSVTE